jgi:transposase
MLYLAMDVSRDEIVFYADITGKHYTVPNDPEEITAFLKGHSFAPEDTLVGCESTADYHIVPCLAAIRSGYPVKVINPILTRQVINATVRKKKTDYSDAEIIAKLLRDGHGETVNEESFQQTKRTILRTEQKLVQCASDLKRIHHSLKNKSKAMDVSDAMEAIERCIGVLEDESDKLTDKATEKQDRQEEIIDSIPGFGQKLSAIISAEAGDIRRFPSSSQFKAYVGIDPKVTQSGNKMHTGHITKRGNPNLRCAIYLAANINRQHDPELKEFYEKKMNEGKSHRHAVCAVSRKLCERIYAIVLKNSLYEVRKDKNII